MDNIQTYSDFLGEDKPAGAPDFHHSDAPDANGRFRDLSPKDLAAWLIKTRKKDLKKISGSLTQQVVFNRNEDPEYAEKMEKTRKEVYKQLGRKDLLDQMDESLVVERSISGEEVWDHIVGITPEEDDIPWGFEDQIKDREFQMTKIDLKKLLKTDPDFKAHYKGGEQRYHDDEVSEYDLDFELVVVNGELLDGYSRASTLLRKGITKAYGYVSEAITIMEENLEEGKIRVDLKRIMTKIMGSLEFKTDPKVRQELLSVIKDDVEQILDKHGYEMFEADKKPGPDAYMTGLDDETEEEKEDAMKKQADMDDDDPNAYKELPGDKEAREKGKVKTSKHVKSYHELYGDKADEALADHEDGDADYEEIYKDYKYKNKKESFGRYIEESKYEDMLEDGYGHVHFIVSDLDTAEELADKIEAKDLADCDYYEQDGKVYLRAALSVGYGGKEVTNIKKIERIVKQKAQAGSPEIWADDLDEGVWSASALRKMNAKPMPGRYFISDENGNILEKGLKTSRSWVTYLQRHGKGSYGYLGGQKPAVVNIHDGKNNNEVVEQYYWVDKYGKGNFSIDIDNPTAGQHGKIDHELVNYKEIERQLGVANESIVAEAIVKLPDLDLNRFQKNKFKKHLAKHNVKLTHVKFDALGKAEITYSAESKDDLLCLFKASGGYYQDAFIQRIEESINVNEGLGISMGMIEPFLPVIIGYIESGGAGRLVHKIKKNLKAIPKVINNFRNMKDISRILNKLEKHPKIDGYLNNLDPEGVEVMFQELSMADMKIMYSHLGLDWNPKEYLEIKRKADKGEWATESAIYEEKAEGDRGPIDDDAIEKGLKNKSEETGVPIALLRIVMRRGMAAWKSGHRPGATQQQWGYARVNSFLTKQPGTWGGADSDVAKEVRDGGHDSKLKKA